MARPAELPLSVASCHIALHSDTGIIHLPCNRLTNLWTGQPLYDGECDIERGADTTSCDDRTRIHDALMSDLETVLRQIPVGCRVRSRCTPAQPSRSAQQQRSRAH